MIIELSDDLFKSPIDEHSRSAISCASAAARFGHHRVLVSPVAVDLASSSVLSQAMIEDLHVISSGWLDAQAITKKSTRVVTVTPHPALDGKIEGNRFYVLADRVLEIGIYREPSIVFESMFTDAALIKLYMAEYLELSEFELRRYWCSRFDQGGGSTLFTYIGRYIEDPIPSMIICDRDGPGIPKKDKPAGKCLSTLTKLGLFPDRDSAVAGGFSPTHANFAFRIHRVRAIENIVFPHIMELFFDNLSSGHGDTSRRETLLNIFPHFPELSPPECETWISMRMKNNDLHGGDIFNSGCIDRLVKWVNEKPENVEAFKIALRRSLEIVPFQQSLHTILDDIWALGQRHYALA